MKRHWVIVIFLFTVVTAVLIARYYLADYLTVESVKQHRQQLLSFIAAHNIEASVTLVLLFVASGLFLPGALALTIAGGMMFGTLATVILANVGATTGAVLAFILARSAMGHWIQERFKHQLERFNREMSRHGQNYLFSLRLLPVAPFFVINYCAGITKMPLRTFIWTTSAGLLPGSVIHAFIGQQLRYVNTFSDLLSWKLIVALLLPPFIALMPVLAYHFERRFK